MGAGLWTCLRKAGGRGMNLIPAALVCVLALFLFFPPTVENYKKVKTDFYWEFMNKVGFMNPDRESIYPE